MPYQTLDVLERCIPIAGCTRAIWAARQAALNLKTMIPSRFMRSTAMVIDYSQLGLLRALDKGLAHYTQ